MKIVYANGTIIDINMTAWREYEAGVHPPD
jgi:hypothetical protein